MTTSLPQRVGQLLRSRRLAAVLIGLLTAFSAITTVIPRGTTGDAKVRAWAAHHPIAEPIVAAVGLHKAFVSPAFLGLAAALALCTAACALERTRRAWRLARGMRGGSSGSARSGRAQYVIQVGSVTGGSDNGLGLCANRLRAMGLRVRQGESGIEAHSGAFALLGSPVFHWSLVALMVVVALGQATRVEGELVLPIGKRVVDEKANYRAVFEAPAFNGRYSGLEFVASSLSRHLVVGGSDRGPTPYVTAYRAGQKLKSTQVYANSPLHVGSVMMHMGDYGPSVVLSLESSGGAEMDRQSFYLKKSQGKRATILAQGFALNTPSGQSVQGRVSVEPRGDTTGTPAAARVILLTSVGGGKGDVRRDVLGVGDSVTLPEGSRLTVADVSDYVDVRVANDWSVSFIYALVIVALLSLGVALLVPTRRVRLVFSADEGSSVSVYAWHSGKDPTFARRVAEVVQSAVMEVAA